MPKIAVKVITFGLLLISLTANFFLYRERELGKVVIEVVDGDTFQLKSGKRVRLMGVDAPEYDRCGGAQAKDRLSELVFGKKVTLKEEIPEAFGRALALVYVDSKLINGIILAEGWGRPDYRRNSERSQMTQAFNRAKDEKLGIFTLCRSEGPESACVIKGNIDAASSEKFYHLPDCSHYDQIVIEKDRGEVYFCTEEEAIKAGFAKAGGCP